MYGKWGKISMCTIFSKFTDRAVKEDKKKSDFLANSYDKLHALSQLQSELHI